MKNEKFNKGFWYQLRQIDNGKFVGRCLILDIIDTRIHLQHFNGELASFAIDQIQIDYSDR